MLIQKRKIDIIILWILKNALSYKNIQTQRLLVCTIKIEITIIWNRKFAIAKRPRVVNKQGLKKTKTYTKHGIQICGTEC